MQRATILALSILSLGLLPLACTQNFNLFASSEGTGGATASTGSTTHSSTTTSGTGGSDAGPSCMGAMSCTVATDCGMPANDCVTNTCTGGCCGTADVAMATSCHSGGGNVCDGAGKCIPCLQATDCAATGTVCATATCTANACGTMSASKGTTCTDNGGTVCDGTGKCVPAACTDGLRTGNETDIDCGGGGPCGPCADGLHCKVGTDCIDKVCAGGGGNKTCQAPTCNDGQQNGQETDVDCGGPTCDGQGKKCAVTQGCAVPGDCTSNNCQNNVCGLPADGATCTANNQCASNHCVAGICCNSACGTTCMACTALLTGGTNGHCANILAGKPAPGGQCQAATCGNTGNCNAGACEQAAPGSMCGSVASCLNGMLTAAGSCGGGTCGAGATTSCNGYGCIGNACRTTCNAATDTGCATGHYCEGSGANGTCAAQLGTGSACTSSVQCKNGLCLGSDAGALLDGGVDAGGAAEQCN